MVIRWDSSHVDVEGLVRYIYRGEVDVEPDRLQSFLRTAEVLKIKGLADQNLTQQGDAAVAAVSGAKTDDAGIKKEASSATQTTFFR